MITILILFGINKILILTLFDEFFMKGYKYITSVLLLLFFLLLKSHMFFKGEKVKFVRIL